MKTKVLVLLMSIVCTQKLYAQTIDSLYGSTRYDSTDYQFSAKWERLFENVKPIPNSGYFSNQQPFGLPLV